jgi:hypothetical protein
MVNAWLPEGRVAEDPRLPYLTDRHAVASASASAAEPEVSPLDDGVHVLHLPPCMAG